MQAGRQSMGSVRPATAGARMSTASAGSTRGSILGRQSVGMGTSPRFSGRTAHQETPGPGTYTVVVPQKAKVGKEASAPSFGFGTSPREGASRPATAPGPGQYSTPEASRSRKSVFGTAVRGSTRGTRVQSPGPGTYNSGTTIGKEGTKITMAGRREGSPRKTDTPGPGTYHGTSQPAARAKGTSPSPRGASPPAGRGWGFGTSTRESRPRGTSPGPGQYSTNNNNTVGAGPKISMGTRRSVGGSPATLPQKAA